jgi:hypothetical protein
MADIAMAPVKLAAMICKGVQSHKVSGQKILQYSAFSFLLAELSLVKENLMRIDAASLTAKAYRRANRASSRPRRFIFL